MPLPISSTETQFNGKRDVEEQEAKSFNGHNDYRKLVDTYGNEFEIPDYSINDIRKAIPAACYERSATKGLLYVLRNIVSVATTFYLANTFVASEYIPWKSARVVVWLIYGFVNGLFGTGLWVLAHECGHQALSKSKLLNDTVGWIIHSALLVPYFSWKISHGKHHKATGHMERDMVFVPRTRAGLAKRFGISFEKLSEVTRDAPINSLLFVIARQLFGWNIYLLSNDTGHDFHARQGQGCNPDGTVKHNGWLTGVNHFSPRSPLFEKCDALHVLLSDLGLIITASILYHGHTWGFQKLFVWYFTPYIWVNHWLAATIDRDFGFIGHHFHGITKTHVLHHYVSTIPFYNANEASAAIKSVMGRYHLSAPHESLLGFMKKLYTNFRVCQWVEPSTGAAGEGKDVLFYRNRRGVGVAPIDVRLEGSMKLFDGKAS